MAKIAKKYNRTIKILSKIGVYVGFAGMGLILFFLIKSFIDLIINPSAPAAMSLVIPGVKIPGSAIFVPFWYGIIALFFVIVVHEFAHGVVCKAYKIRVKSSGLGLFAIIPLAFVEPDEESLVKKDVKIRNAMFAAGPFANVLLAILALLILSFAVSPVLSNMTEKQGVFLLPESGKPAYLSGIINTTLITSFNNIEIKNVQEFISEIKQISPGEKFNVSNYNETFTILPIEQEGKTHIGVRILQKVEVKEGTNMLFFNGFFVFGELLFWIYLLSLGIGLANLLPLGPIDGGRMIHATFSKYFGEEKGLKIWTQISIILLVILLINIFLPIIREVFF
jgi:membrane-associated protease RseP (regulator of RpoE activity)